MRVYISGGCKSGKSAYAQDLAVGMRNANAPLYYLATMIPADEEDEARIIRHKNDRDGYGFITVEAGSDILSAVENCDYGGAFLLDSVTALLANEMFLPSGRCEKDAYKKIYQDLSQLLNKINDIVIVSDFIYSDAFLYDEMTEAYRQGLAYIDRQVAKICDVVLEAYCGTFIAHKSPRNALKV